MYASESKTHTEDGEDFDAKGAASEESYVCVRMSVCSVPHETSAATSFAIDLINVLAIDLKEIIISILQLRTLGEW